MALYKTYCEFNFLNTVISESLKDFGLLTITMVKSSNQETRHKSKHYSLNIIFNGVWDQLQSVGGERINGVSEQQVPGSPLPTLLYAGNRVKAKKTGQA